MKWFMQIKRVVCISIVSPEVSCSIPGQFVN